MHAFLAVSGLPIVFSRTIKQKRIINTAKIQIGIVSFMFLSSIIRLQYGLELQVQEFKVLFATGRKVFKKYSKKGKLKTFPE